MPIEISGSPQTHSQVTSDSEKVTVARSEASVPQQETGESVTKDTVSLTETASNLQQLSNSMSELPVVDSQRVSDIRQAIANGDYPVDAQAIADKMTLLESALGAGE